MSSQRLEIVIQEPTRTFFSGQKLIGAVRFITGKVTRITELKLYVKGKSYVHWGSGDDSYTSVETIIRQKSHLHPPAGHGQSTALSSGIHEYPFEFVVGADWPTSVELKRSFVRYWLKAEVHFDGWKLHKEAKMEFTVNKISRLDTLERSHLEPKVMETNNGIVRIKGSVERSAWVPGETIYFDGSAECLAGHFKKAKLTFLQVNVLHSGKSKSKNVSKLYETKSGRGHLAQWNHIAINIPPVRATTVNKVLDTEYFIQLKVDPGFLHGCVKLTIPIIIGNIPLLSSLTNFQPPTGCSRNPRMHLNGIGSFVVPYTFENAFAVEQRRSLDTYWPRYPIYKVK